MKDVPDWLVRAFFGQENQPLPPGSRQDKYGDRCAMSPFATNPAITAVAGSVTNRTFVATENYGGEPRPWAVQLKFSQNGVSGWSTTLNAGLNQILTVTIDRGLDDQGGNAYETYTILPGGTVPFCQFIGSRLRVSVKTEAQNPEGIPDQVFVQCVAAPLTAIDCDEINPPPTPTPTVTIPARWSANTTTFSYAISEIEAAPSPGFPAMTANTARAQLFIQNNSDTDVMVGFGVAFLEPGSEVGAFILPGGQGAIYESPIGGFAGDVKLAVPAGTVDVDGYVLVSEGAYT